MKSRSTSQGFIMVLWVLALFVAQTFGSPAGYVCRCDGKPVPTQTSHCHGPHGATCHTDNAPHREDGAGPREDHQVVNEDVSWRPVEVARQVIAPQVLLAVLPLRELLLASQETNVPARHAVDFGESPPFGVAVARSVVLLI